jgi:GNAT superfamily N-acetyltransferase
VSLVIRAARQQELPAISALLRESWHATYDAILGPERVEEISQRWHAPAILGRQVEAMEAGDDCAFTVALLNGALVGTALATRNPASPGEAPVVDLQRIYVLPDMQGQGVGRALLAGTLKTWRDAGRIRLEVHRENGRAIAFYQRVGFRQVSTGTACGQDQQAAIPHLILEARLPLLLLRPAVDADAQDLFGLLTLCFAEYPGCFTDPHDDLPDLVRPGHWLERRDAAGRHLGGAFLVLDDARGRICASIAYDLPKPDCAELHRLYVRPDCRRRSIAARLVGHVERCARQDGARSILLWSDTRFVSAHTLYQGLGYQLTGATRELHDISRTSEYEFVKVL